MKQLTKDKAVKFLDRREYEAMTHIERAKFQLAQNHECMPFGIFHESLEKALGRQIFIYEIEANKSALMQELSQLDVTKKQRPTRKTLESVVRFLEDNGINLHARYADLETGIIFGGLMDVKTVDEILKIYDHNRNGTWNYSIVCDDE